jgi:hypothetical protein
MIILNANDGYECTDFVRIMFRCKCFELANNDKRIMRLSRSLLKLIDEAIVPGLLVFAAKLLGLIVVNAWLNLSWDPSGGSLLPLFSYRSPEAFALANGWSNILVLVVILTGLLLVLIRAHVFHNSHISPKVAVSLVRRQLTSLAATSWEVYHQAVVWLCYLWLALILFSLQAVYGVSPWWLDICGTIAALLLSWLLIVDVERELEIERGRHAS